MLTALLGLVGAFTYGSADFLGGLAARRISTLRVTAIAALSGLVLLLILVPFTGGQWSASAVAWGALSGVTGALAISLLYACLAIGPMSILSPLTALVSAIVPLTWGLGSGERLHPPGYVGLGLALVAVVLVGFVPERGAVRPTLRALAMAVGSGAMIGAFMIIIDQTPKESGLVPLVLNRAVNGTIMLVAIAILGVRARRVRRAGRPSRARLGAAVAGLVTAGDGRMDATFPANNASLPDDGLAVTDSHVAVGVGSDPASTGARGGWLPGLPFALACGVLDTAANVLMLAGIRVGGVTITSVLVALYPAGTIILAAVVLRERIAPVQWAGLGLALTAGVLLALP